MLHATNATHFDLKPHVIKVLSSLKGLENEDSYSRVGYVWQWIGTWKWNGTVADLIDMREKSKNVLYKKVNFFFSDFFI